MSWRDRFRDAEIGGVPFHVRVSDGTAGRNVHVHEYPKRDRSWPEDMGRKTRRFTFEAYLLGDDSDLRAQRLLDVIETAGAKRLVHPWIGEMRITVLDFRGPRFSDNEGGMVRFSLDVAEYDELVFPAASADTRAAVEAAAEAAGDASEADFADSFDVLDAPAFVADAAGDFLNGLSDQLGTITSRITSIPDALTAFVADLNDFTASISNLILAPATLGARIGSLIGQIRTMAAQPGAAFDILEGYFDFQEDAQAVPTTTANRQRQADNQTAIKRHVQRSAVIEAARVAAGIDYPSYDEAISVRTSLIEAIDTQSETAGDLVYAELVRLRSTVARDITARGANLARLTTITLPQSLPAVVLAWRLYGDPERAEEIIARNGVSDPLFLPGGTPLEVLTDA